MQNLNTQPWPLHKKRIDHKAAGRLSIFIWACPKGFSSIAMISFPFTFCHYLPGNVCTSLDIALCTWNYTDIDIQISYWGHLTAHFTFFSPLWWFLLTERWKKAKTQKDVYNYKVKIINSWKMKLQGHLPCIFPNVVTLFISA